MGAAETDIGVALSAVINPVAEQLLADIATNRGRPDPDSDLAATMAAHEPSEDELRLRMRPALEVLCDTLLTRAIALGDNLRATSLIAVHGSHAGNVVALSLAPIARAALEALAGIYWTCEPDLPASERVNRMAIDVLDSHLRLGKLNRWPPQEGEVPIQPDWDDTEATLRAWGVPTKRGDSGAVHVTDDNGTGRGRDTAQAILAPLMRSEDNSNLGAYIYADFTRLSHASVDGILSRADVSWSSEGVLEYRFQRTRHVAASGTLLWAVHEPLQAYYGTMGWDFGPLERRVEAGIERMSPRLEAVAVGGADMLEGQNDG